MYDQLTKLLEYHNARLQKASDLQKYQMQREHNEIKELIENIEQMQAQFSKKRAKYVLIIGRKPKGK